MKKHLLVATLIAVSCAAVSPSANAQESRGLFSNVGVDVETYLPFSGKTKDTFGSRFTGVGLGFGSIRPKVGGGISPDISIMSTKQNGDRALLALAGLQYRRPFSDKTGVRLVPYFGAGANLLYGRLRVDGDRESDFGAGASVFLGASISRHAFVEARVRLLSEVASYDFSGLSLSAGVRF